MRSIKTKSGFLLRRLYLLLPFDWNTRLRLKGWVFRTFSWLLLDTNAYRRWAYFQQGQDGSLVPPQQMAMTKATVGGGCTEPLHDVLVHHVRELHAAMSQRHGRDYVEIAQSSLVAPPKARAIAFYLPQFHPIAENDAWWGKGFTEWTNVSKAQPQFLGHYQPHLPGELGFYDLRLPDVMRRQIELARLYGIEAFCFHYYWFSGRRLLERPLEQYLADPSLDLPFCLCWANENWTRRWDGMETDVLLGQVYNDDNDEAFILDLITALRDPRYLRLDGRPLVVIYRPSLLPDCRRTLQHWRETCRREGVGEIFLAMVQFDRLDPTEFGFDAALEFPPHKLASGLACANAELQLINPEYRGYSVRYQDIVQVAESMPVPDYPLMRGVFPSWDNEARKPGRGYTFVGSTPQLYRRWLESAIGYAIEHPVAGESVVFINAWNEWAEGAHLEPDRKYGYAYLQATRDALEHSSEVHKTLLLSHDAHPHGAQYLALNLAKELRRLGVDVHVGLLGPGILEAEFGKIASVYRMHGSPELHRRRLAELYANGFRTVIANTAVSGRYAALLKELGFTIVSLVHELPGVIRDYELEPEVADLGRCADVIVASSLPVMRAVEDLIEPEERAKVVLRPQGLYVRSRHRRASREAMHGARTRLRAKLGLPDAAIVALTIGYADHRKGVDLMVDVAEYLVGRDPRLHFVWVGHWDANLRPEIEDRVARASLGEHVHFRGLDFDTDDYYAGADVYALYSREDPFPSVVLESLSVGTPVVAFRGTGGGADLLDRGVGLAVPAFDSSAFGDALVTAATSEPVRHALSSAAMDLIESEFSFRQYAMDLVCMGAAPIPKVSVVVPNYNYARYLRQRLDSVCAQTFPLYELIVLDDRSTDDSLRVLDALRRERGLNPDPRIIVSETNSGSVFRQWLRGVEASRGDYVWIAEADDLADPGFLAAVMQHLHAHPEAVLGYTQSTQIDSNSQQLAGDYLAYTLDLSQTRWRSTYIANGAEEVAAGLAVKNTIPNVSAVVFRREPLLKVLRDNLEEIQSLRVAGDWLVYLYLMKEGGVVFEPASLNLHRRHAESVTLDTQVERHYNEVVSVQARAQAMFSLDADVVMRASAYADVLRRQFGLAGTA
jgi:glycosyltransferase involved in cell wall biosynthesis